MTGSLFLKVSQLWNSKSKVKIRYFRGRSIVYSKGLRWTSRQIWKANDNLWLVWSYTKTSLNRTEKRWVHFKQRSDKSSNSESSVFFASTTRKRTLFIDWTKSKEFQKVSIFVLDFSVGMKFSFFSDVISKGVVLPCPNAFRFHEWVSAWRRVKSIRLFSLERSKNGLKIPQK